MRKIFLGLFAIVSLFLITGCGAKTKSILEELNEIQNQLTDKYVKYNETHNRYTNFSSCYVDEENKVVIVELIDNSPEKQDWFRTNIYDFKSLRFKQGGPYTTHNFEEYEKKSTLTNNDINTNYMVMFSDVLYGKSSKAIDYAGGSKSSGLIEALIPGEYIPKNNGETNSKDLLYALVFDVKKDSLVLKYNNEYVLFEKIERN